MLSNAHSILKEDVYDKIKTFSYRKCACNTCSVSFFVVNNNHSVFRGLQTEHKRGLHVAAYGSYTAAALREVKAGAFAADVLRFNDLCKNLAFTAFEIFTLCENCHGALRCIAGGYSGQLTGSPFFCL